MGEGILMGRKVPSFEPREEVHTIGVSHCRRVDEGKDEGKDGPGMEAILARV